MVKLQNLPNDSVHFFMKELTSRIVAESGKPSDRFHLGKILLRSLKDDPEFVVQIDGATGKAMTSAELLEKTMRCAVAIRNFGLQIGDVIVLMAPNHLEVTVPFQAALCLGVITAPVNSTSTVNELQATFALNQPKMVFCQSEKARDIQAALNALQLDAHIITFDVGESLCSFANFLSQYSDDSSIEDFKPNEFNPEDTIACITGTGGTTGLPKTSASTHKNFATNVPYMWAKYSTFPSPTRMVLVQMTLDHMSAIINFILPPVIRVTRLQTSRAMNREHIYYLINTYRPTFMIITPLLMSLMIKPEYRKQCDFTCFDTIMLGGMAVSDVLIAQIKEVTPDTDVSGGYGMTELSGAAFHPNSSLPASCIGQPYGCSQYRIIDVKTNEDIFEPNTPGELWIRGNGVFKEYYNNPEATKEALTEDHWFKTGDMVYRDKHWNFFYVERIKLLLRYKNINISPVELENVIRQHRGVEDVAVTSVPDSEHGDAPVACVVRRSDSDVTAQHIMDLVKEMWQPIKQLVEVVFVDEIPMACISQHGDCNSTCYANPANYYRFGTTTAVKIRRKRFAHS